MFLIKVVSVVLTILFGIVASLTETRDKKTNRLTKWGKIAILGIALMGGLTLVEVIPPAEI